MISNGRKPRVGDRAMRRGSPPPIEFFAPARPAAGAEAIAIDLGGLRVEIGGLSGGLRDLMDRRYAPYSVPASGAEGALRLRLGLEPRAYFVEPPASPEFNPIFIACDGTRVRYLGYRVAAWFDTGALTGEILLASGTYEPESRALENLVRTAVAWMAATRGGALVHAASAVRHGRAYLFFGESGAGKSTLSACDARGRVVSDDLTLILPREGGGLDVVGSPFRGTYEGGEPVVGRFPLAAGFRILKAGRAEVEAAPRVRALAELVGNLPFVAEAFRERPDLFEGIERAFAAVPLAHLRFRKDDSYWDAIERAGL